MKIIINQPRATYYVGGAEMISFEHAINLFELGNEVYFFTISPKSIGLKYSTQFEKFYEKYSGKINIIELEQEQKIRYIYNIEPGEDRYRWNIESIFYNQKLYEYIFKHKTKYDIIFSYYILDAIFIPRRFISKNVLYLCGTPKQQNDFQKSLISVYDINLAISDEVKESWQSYYNDRIKVISTGVDCNRFTPPKKEASKYKGLTLLYVGRLISRKNIDKIIYAFEKLYDKYEIRLFVVGDGPERKNLEGISKNVIFTGVVNDTDEYYKKADIFISPSGYGEGLQGTILEAMSCGLTIIATNTAINKRLLSHDRGFTIEPNVNSIVDGIETAILADRDKIAANCRKYVLDHYDWKKKTTEILEVL